MIEGKETVAETPKFKRYRSHKIVEALPIVGIEPTGVGDAKAALILEGGIQKPHPKGTNYVPVLGDYFIRYEDGYESLSPKGAFEKGYTLEPGQD